MSQQVQVSRSVLIGLVTLLTLTLIAVGFLLGKQSQSPSAVEIDEASPSPQELALVVEQASAERTLDERLDRLEQHIDSVNRRSGSPQALATSSPSLKSESEHEETTIYLEKIDALLGRSALEGHEPLFAKLLQRAMAGNSEHAESLLGKTRQTKTELETVEPPKEAREHHRLLTSQLDLATTLLEEVNAANSSGDTQRLKQLIEQSSSSEDFSLLQSLDRKLRGESHR